MALRNAPAAVLVLCLTLAACGGGGDSAPSKAEAVKQANSICAAANARVEKGFDASSDSQVREGTISQNGVRYPVVRATLAKMRALDQPKTGAAQWRAFVRAQAEAVAASKALGGGDTQTALSLGPRLGLVERTLRTAGDTTKATATELGATRCVAGPYQQSLQGVAVKDEPPEFGAGLKKAEVASGPAFFRFQYPGNWTRKTVGDAGGAEQAVAYGSDHTFCIATHTSSDYHGRNEDRRALVAYAQRQIAAGRKGADSYKLYGVGPAAPEDSMLRGVLLRRRSVEGSKVHNGRVAFLFPAGSGPDGRDRFVIDCETTDTRHFQEIDEHVFAPFVAGFDARYTSKSD